VRDSFSLLRDLLSRKRVGASRTAFRERRDNRSQSSKPSLPVVWPRRACTAARQDARFGFSFPSAINGEGMLLPAPSDSTSYGDITLALRRRPNSRRNPCFNDAIHHLSSNNSRQLAQSELVLEMPSAPPAFRATKPLPQPSPLPSVVPVANSASQNDISSSCKSIYLCTT
jgi:hypothetical protein